MVVLKYGRKPDDWQVDHSMVKEIFLEKIFIDECLFDFVS